MKRTESLKFEFKNLEIRFHKCQVSFIFVKTVKCKRGISYLQFLLLNEEKFL